MECPAHQCSCPMRWTRCSATRARGPSKAVPRGGHRPAACTTSARGTDTVGALAVNLDPRESELTPATRSDRCGRSGAGAPIVSLADIRAAAFAAGARGHLRGPFLVLALLLGLAEVALASLRRKAA